MRDILTVVSSMVLSSFAIYTVGYLFPGIAGADAQKEEGKELSSSDVPSFQ